ncbi:MAG: GDP-mannose 4,6-dehydratase, partial [Planctomycetota bacterium]
MRILISGGGGFLGSHLTDLLLEQGHHVVGLDNFVTGRPQNISHLKGHERYQFFEHDVIQPITGKLADDIGTVDRIYHMASPASPIGYVKEQVLTMKVNSQGTWNLIEFAQSHGNSTSEGLKGARFLMASTSECYGDPAVHPQPETYWGNVNPIGLRSMYDEAKRFSEACCMAYHRERKADTRLIRIFNTYGPRMDPTDGRVVINFIKQ